MLFGTGVDIIGIGKFHQAIEQRGQRLLNRIFTENEINYCSGKLNKSQHLAARFACKEAISKALKMNWRKTAFNLKEIEIINNHFGEPNVRLYGRAKEIADALKIDEIKISLSHCSEYAVATAAILKRS